VVSDEEFETELNFEDLKSKYRNTVRKSRDGLTRKHVSERAELRKLKLAGIEAERTHRDLLNLCVYPFTEEGKGRRELGYRFLRASPLSELGLPNFDFLIARLYPVDEVAILIVGEAKGSVGSPKGVVNEVVKKREIFTANSGLVLTQYLGQEKDRRYILETVVAVNSIDSANMIAAVVESAEPIKVWHGPTTGTALLSIAAPPSGTRESHRYLHADHNLNELLDKLPTIRRTFDVWPKTHTLIQLGALVRAAHPEDYGMSVKTVDLEAVLTRDMFYLSPKEREELALGLVSQGLAMGFLSPIAGPGGEFKIVAKGARRDALEATMQEKWLRWQLEQDLETEIEQDRQAIQETLRGERSRRKTMRDY
jgi:hypothetical protein